MQVNLMHILVRFFFFFCNLEVMQQNQLLDGEKCKFGKVNWYEMIPPNCATIQTKAVVKAQFVLKFWGMCSL